MAVRSIYASNEHIREVGGQIKKKNLIKIQFMKKINNIFTYPDDRWTGGKGLLEITLV